MKKILLVSAILAVFLPGTGLKAQDVQSRLDEALMSYRQEDLDNARFSLQEALNEINRVVGKEILAVLPSELNGMSKVEDADDVTGVNTGFAGLFVHRSYKDETREASVDLISDSPMLTGINTILAMPGFMTSDPNQKRIKVGNYKALMTRSTSEEGPVSYDVQIPLSSSLLTFQCSGFDDENEVVKMVNTIPVDKILSISE
jgi:hypothetical protein